MDSFRMADCSKPLSETREHIRVSTWATDFTGLFGLRNFKMEDEAGEMTAWANSVWVYMDMKKEDHADRRKKRSRLIGRKHHWM